MPESCHNRADFELVHQLHDERQREAARNGWHGT
jgi:hypothetical protein